MRGVKLIVGNVNVDLAKHVRITLGLQRVSTLMKQIDMCANVEILKPHVTKKQNVASKIRVSAWRVSSKNKLLINDNLSSRFLEMKKE